MAQLVARNLSMSRNDNSVVEVSGSTPDGSIFAASVRVQSRIKRSAAAFIYLCSRTFCQPAASNFFEAAYIDAYRWS
jgi:cephalosporin-C deacetylase-like acetyl esterase